MKWKRAANGRALRVLLLCSIGLLLLRVFADAQQMASVQVDGSEIAYQAEYQAYTEAASQDGAVICELKVEDPEAGSSGALARVVMPDDENTYVYMDEGALAVMKYDGSEYRRFKADYQLERDKTYTLCVFQDGLAFLDGVDCYTYSGDFNGFTDVAAGWSDESNVFSSSLQKVDAVEQDLQDDTEGSSEDSSEDGGEDNAADQEQTAATEEKSGSSIWLILTFLLALSSNLVALAALRTSNIALRAIRPHRAHVPVQTVAQTRSPQRNMQKYGVHRSATQPVREQPVSQGRRSVRPSEKPVSHTRRPVQSSEKPRQQATVRTPEMLKEPFSLYMDASWRANPEQFVPYQFGSLERGYCTFEKGNDISRDLFVLSGENLIWLNPVRFHPRAPGQGVPISMTECTELAMAFNFCHVGTGEREIALSVPVEMVNFRPARIKKNSDDIWELEQRGIIVFEV